MSIFHSFFKNYTCLVQPSNFLNMINLMHTWYVSLGAGCVQTIYVCYQENSSTVTMFNLF